MTELRFDKSLYAADAVATALTTYAAFAALESVEEPEATLVRVTGKSESRERRVSGEIANHALGRTIQALKK